MRVSKLSSTTHSNLAPASAPQSKVGGPVLFVSDVQVPVTPLSNANKQTSTALAPKAGDPSLSTIVSEGITVKGETG